MLLCRIALLCLFPLLASCGFTPAYQTHGGKQKNEAVQEKLASIEVMPISASRMGQELQNSLQDILRPDASTSLPSKYRLAITLKKEVTPAAIERDRRITRYNIAITANYSLKTLEKNKVIDSGLIRVVASYDSLDSRFSTFVAEEKTTSNAIKELAEQLSTRLMTTKFEAQ